MVCNQQNTGAIGQHNGEIRTVERVSTNLRRPRMVALRPITDHPPARLDVLDRFLFAMSGDDTHEDRALPFPELPWAAAQLAADLELSKV